MARISAVDGGPTRLLNNRVSPCLTPYSTPNLVRGLEQSVEGSRHDVAVGLADRRHRDAAVETDLLDIDALVEIPCDRRVAHGVADDLLLLVLGREACQFNHR